MSTGYTRVLEELLEIKEKVGKIDVIDERLEWVAKMVQEHDQSLYAHNGIRGVVAKVDELEEIKEERDKQKADLRKAQYAFIGSAALLVLKTLADIFVK